MYVKIHSSKDKEVLAVCDEDLIGRIFEDKDLQIKISESFYKGEKKSEKEVLKLIETFNNINLVGKNSIKLAVNNGFISKDNIIYIKGVPHAQIYKI